MNLHNFSNKAIFNDDVLIESQFVKVIQFLTPFGNDFDFNSENIELDYKYRVLDNKEDKRLHIIILEFNMKEKNTVSNDNVDCVLNIVLEGVYRINNSIDEELEKFNVIKHFGSLNLLVNFLRLVVYNVTSMTFNTGFYLPLINITELHKKSGMNDKSKSEKKTVSKRKQKK